MAALLNGLLEKLMRHLHAKEDLNDSLAELGNHRVCLGRQLEQELDLRWMHALLEQCLNQVVFLSHADDLL